jgi:hypothetical protein
LIASIVEGQQRAAQPASPQEAVSRAAERVGQEA